MGRLERILELPIHDITTGLVHSGRADGVLSPVDSKSLTPKDKNLIPQAINIQLDLRYSRRLKSATKFGQGLRERRRRRGRCPCSSNAEKPCGRRSCPARMNQGKLLKKV